MPPAPHDLWKRHLGTIHPRFLAHRHGSAVAGRVESPPAERGVQRESIVAKSVRSLARPCIGRCRKQSDLRISRDRADSSSKWRHCGSRSTAERYYSCRPEGPSVSKDTMSVSTRPTNVRRQLQFGARRGRNRTRRPFQLRGAPASNALTSSEIGQQCRCSVGFPDASIGCCWKVTTHTSSHKAVSRVQCRVESCRDGPRWRSSDREGRARNWPSGGATRGFFGHCGC